VIVHKGKVIKTLARGDLGRLGGDRIKVTVRNIDDRGIAYLKSIGELTSEGSTFFLTSKGADPADVNATLVKMGYTVTEIQTQNQGLEDYFLNLIEGRP